VIKTILASSVLATGILFAGQPAKATWVCGPDECVWVQQHVVVAVPAFATGWAAPIRPNCFWRRGLL